MKKANASWRPVLVDDRKNARLEEELADRLQVHACYACAQILTRPAKNQPTRLPGSDTRSIPIMPGVDQQASTQKDTNSVRADFRLMVQTICQRLCLECAYNQTSHDYVARNLKTKEKR
jgi:hypothetical protein